MHTNRLAWAPGLALLLCTGTPSAHDQVQPPPRHEARLIRFPDTAAHHTLAVDLHTHSVFSDGHVWPSIRVSEALRDGLDALAITEHLEWQPHRDDLPHPDRNRAYVEALGAVPEGSDLILIAGSEITREAPVGHMNAVFITDANALLQVGPDPVETAVDYYIAANQWPATQAVQAANRQGAFVFWNHPYYTRLRPNALARMTEFHKALITAGQLHGIEIANGAIYSEQAHQMAMEHDLAMIGVSDVHNLIDWDYPPALGAHRPVTLVFATERSSAGIREALFAGRTAVWFKDLLISREVQLKPLLRAMLDINDAHYRADTDVLDLTITNNSSTVVRLRNQSPFTFLHYGDDIEVPARGMLKLALRLGERKPEIGLEFDVLNTLTAPKEHLRLRHRLAGILR